MFTAKISTLTDDEIAADIATCRTVIATGHVNGILLDSDSEQYYRDWLECAEEEQTIRADDTRATAPFVECPYCGGEGYIDYRDHLVAKSIVPTVQIIHGKKIVTSHIYPPIPIRTMDWCAYFDGEEELGGYGYGRTEAEAIADFVNNLNED